MSKAGLILFAVVILAAAGWVWWTFFPSPERLIARRFQKMAGAASVHPGQGYIPRLAAAQSIGSYFAPMVDLSIDVPRHRERNSISRDDLVQGLMGAQLSGGLSVKVSDLNIVVASDGQSAQAEMTVTARLSGDSDLIVQEMKFSLRLTAGEWLITRVQTVRTFSEIDRRLFPSAEPVKQYCGRQSQAVVSI